MTNKEINNLYLEIFSDISKEIDRKYKNITSFLHLYGWPTLTVWKGNKPPLYGEASYGHVRYACINRSPKLAEECVVCQSAVVSNNIDKLKYVKIELADPDLVAKVIDFLNEIIPGLRFREEVA